MRSSLFFFLSSACHAVPADSDVASVDTEIGEGTLALTFRLDEDYLSIMDEEPVGHFWGAVYRGDEVTGLGPVEGAQTLEEVEVEVMDLRPSGGPSGVLYTTAELPAMEVVVLGFLDSDANADPADVGPDDRDPVTLPNDNDFDVIDGEETTVEVFFGLLNP